jgi:hypothetical protein
MTDTDRKNSFAISRPVSPRFATRRLLWNQSRKVLWMNGELSEFKKENNRSHNGRSCMERFVQYHTITVTVKVHSRITYMRKFRYSFYLQLY